MFPQLISQTTVPARRGPRGLSFRGFGDDGPIGIPGVTAYRLANGHTVYIPSEWDTLTSVQKLLWIQTSDLSAQDANQLETEAGISTPPIGTDPFGQYPVYTAGGSGGGSGSGGYDYVHAGDVIRVSMAIPQAGDANSNDFNILISRIPGQLSGYNLGYVASSTGWFSTTATIDVQALNDFSHLNDVASLVQTAVQSTGAEVSGAATASFVSKAAQTGGGSQVHTPPAPGQSHSLAQMLGLGGGSTTAGALGLSSGLLLAGGAAVLLIILAKK